MPAVELVLVVVVGFMCREDMLLVEGRHRLLNKKLSGEIGPTK